MTDLDSIGHRHLNFDNLDRLWSNLSPIVLACPGDPWVRIELEPQRSRIRLVTPWRGAPPDTTRMRHVTTDLYVDDGLDVVEVIVSAADSVHAAYSLVASIADGVQLSGLPPAAAIRDAIERHESLFKNRQGLSREQEVGLYGELLILEHLIATMGAQTAIASWVGPFGEEHDYALPGEVHVECKTTTSERRVHVVSGLTQLVPPLGGTLLLASTQLTSAGRGHGRSLTGLVTDLFGAAGHWRGELNERLQAVGWGDAAQDLANSAWTLRTRSRCYLVDESFPALTAEGIRAVVPSFELVSDVRYRIDVTDLPTVDPPAMLTDYFDDEVPM